MDRDLIGRRIRLLRMDNDPDPIAPGSEGTVDRVFDSGQIGVKWDNGRRLILVPEDRYEVEVQGSDYVMLRERDLHAVAAERIEASTGLYL